MLLATTNITADPLENALTIILGQSEVVQSKQRMSGIISQGSDWTTNVRLSSGYADKENDAFSGGFQNRAGITFEMPLGGGISQTDKEKAQALSALYEAKESLTKTFILEIQKLATMKGAYDGKDRIYAYTSDQLLKLRNKYKEAKNKGNKQIIATLRGQLGQLLKEALTRENEARQAWTAFNSMHMSVCRIYGKAEWKQLSVHTFAYIEILAPTPKPIIKKPDVDTND